MVDDVDKTSLFKANPPPENHNSEDDNGNSYIPPFYKGPYLIS